MVLPIDCTWLLRLRRRETTLKLEEQLLVQFAVSYSFDRRTPYRFSLVLLQCHLLCAHDFITSFYSNPLGNGTILLLFLVQESLDHESLLRFGWEQIPTVHSTSTA